VWRRDLAAKLRAEGWSWAEDFLRARRTCQNDPCSTGPVWRKSSPCGRNPRQHRHELTRGGGLWRNRPFCTPGATATAEVRTDF
jgi:hypothetical protein